MLKYFEETACFLVRTFFRNPIVFIFFLLGKFWEVRKETFLMFFGSEQNISKEFIFSLISLWDTSKTNNLSTPFTEKRYQTDFYLINWNKTLLSSFLRLLFPLQSPSSLLHNIFIYHFLFKKASQRDSPRAIKIYKTGDIQKVLFLQKNLLQKNKLKNKHKKISF